MRRFAPLLFLALIAAKGSKKTPPPADPAPAPAAAAEAPAEAAPAPEAEPEPAPAPVVKNADFNVTVAFSDGTSKAGHVKTVERTVDFFGDDGWTTEGSDIKLVVGIGNTEKSVLWGDVKSIAITPGKIPDDVDCTYSSDFTPWMYDCTIRTTPSITLKDGTKGTVVNRHRWRFTLDDGEKVEFQVYKFSIREQDERAVSFGDEQTENYALYTKLQDQLRSAVKTQVVRSITVQ